VTTQKYTIKTQEVTAQEIYQLTSETLQAHFQLDMSKSAYEAQDIWDVVVAAAVERVTIEMACELLEEAPSANTVRKALYRLLGRDEALGELEASVNRLLVARLPKHLFASKLVGAADLTEVPYHGEHDEDDELVRRGKAKEGTSHFHAYATLCIVKHNKRYTLALTLMRRSDKALDGLKRLLIQGETLGLRLQRLYLDRGFDNNGVVAYLKTQPFPTIIPLTQRGKSGGTRQLLTGRKSHQTTYTRISPEYGAQTLQVTIVCRYSKGRYKRCGIVHFAYLVIGHLKMRPDQIFREYRRRFGIESSYRLMDTMRARTTTHCVAVRLFFVALAFLLLNLWCFVKWAHLFVSTLGPRRILHHLLPLARWRLWLWEMIKQRLGFSLKIVIPLSS
jgi:putative transposase